MNLILLILILDHCLNVGAFPQSMLVKSPNSPENAEQIISGIFLEHLKRKELEKAKSVLDNVIRENYPEALKQLARQIVNSKSLSDIWFQNPLQRELSRAYALLLFPDWLTVPGLIKFCFNFDCCYWCSLRETINDVDMPPNVQETMMKAFENEVLRCLDRGDNISHILSLWMMLKPTTQQVLSMGKIFMTSKEWTLSYQKEEINLFTQFLKRLERNAVDSSDIRLLLHVVQDLNGFPIDYSANLIQELTIEMFLYHSRHCSQLKKLLKNKQMIKFMNVTVEQFVRFQKQL
jgi:hypothetical protein